MGGPQALWLVRHLVLFSLPRLMLLPCLTGSVQSMSCFARKNVVRPGTAPPLHCDRPGMVQSLSPHHSRGCWGISKLHTTFPNVIQNAAPRRQGIPYLPAAICPNSLRSTQACVSCYFKASCRGCSHIKKVGIVVLGFPLGLIGKVGDGVACRVCTKDVPSGELYVVKNPSVPPIEEREGWTAHRTSNIQGPHLGAISFVLKQCVCG